MTPTATLIPTYIQMLKALSAWLVKAEQGDDGGASLLRARLASDMFPLSTQVRFCCVQAYEGVAWLRGEGFPPIWHELLAEGRHGAETPGTMVQAQTRISDAVEYLTALPNNALDGGETRAIALKLPDGRVFDMSGAEYVRDWALPQFYFHLMAAYAVLRHHGVPLGKADYVQHAFAYLRAAE